MTTPGRRFLITVTAAAALAAGCGGTENGRTADAGTGGVPGARPLVEATTFTSMKGLPLDDRPFAKADGTVLRPKAALPVSAHPGGPPQATLPATQLGGPTWVPVVERRPGWSRVLLPSRPNRVTGWVPDSPAKVQTARSRHRVKVDISDRRLTLADGEGGTGTWPVAVGAPKTPTPTGRTFVMALLAPTKPTYSRLIIPVGAHSETLETYGGGPGTVGFHGWPKKDVFGKAVTHGCVRVPEEALQRLSQVPLGTPVEIVL